MGDLSALNADPTAKGRCRACTRSCARARVQTRMPTHQASGAEAPSPWVPPTVTSWYARDPTLVDAGSPMKRNVLASLEQPSVRVAPVIFRVRSSVLRLHCKCGLNTVHEAVAPGGSHGREEVAGETLSLEHPPA